MDRSLSFGSIAYNLAPSSDSLSLRLRPVTDLTSLYAITRRFIMQKARRHPDLHQGSDRLWAYSFRFYFTPLPGFFSIFPHGTSALSVIREYLALGDGSPGFLRASPYRVVLGNLATLPSHISLTGLSPSLVPLSSGFGYMRKERRSISTLSLLNPTTLNMQRVLAFAHIQFGLFLFRSPLLKESLLFSFPPDTEMVQFSGFACLSYFIQISILRHYSEGVAPFGDLWITGCWHLPRAYRR